MNRQMNLETEIVLLLSQDLKIEPPSPHEDLIETGLLDSLKIVELLAALEQRFAIRFPLQELEIDNFRSLAAITGLVMRMEAAKMPNTNTAMSPGCAMSPPVAD